MMFLKVFKKNIVVKPQKESSKTVKKVSSQRLVKPKQKL